jgi:hypothetical protein
MEMASYALAREIEEQREIFAGHMRNIMSALGYCAGNRVFTSTTVYFGEIDVTELDSALRVASEDFFEILCREDNFVNSISQLYEEIINLEDLPEEDILAIKETLSVDVSLADASLVLLSLRLSQNNDVILITDDLLLRKAVADLLGGNIQEVSVGGWRFATNQLTYTGSLSFLRELHYCCKMSNKRWRATFLSFAEHQYERYEKGIISEETFKRHLEYADQCWAQFREDDRKKREKEINQELYAAFEVDRERQN